MANRIAGILVITCLVIGSLFLLSLADWTWTYSGLPLVAKIGATSPLLLWVLMILLLAAMKREGRI